jgi:DNA polymerase-3 subunit epsilon
MMREIVFDTETTGLSPLGGDRVVEIGCIELLNHIPTGQHFHAYINPEREVSEGAFNVHGLSSAFLSDKPVFAAIAAGFLEFVGQARLVAHNASFDLAFINAELDRLGYDKIGTERIVDTLVIARRKHPFGSNSLDALCQRYGVDNARRLKHGALLDAEILADVYLELLGGRQATLGLAEVARSGPISTTTGTPGMAVHQRPAALPPRLLAEDLAAHAAFVATFPATPLWSDYPEAGPPPAPSID